MNSPHTADWHIGQLFHECDRIYEHQQFLNWLLETLVSEQIDVLLISGDVFDLSNPSAAYVKMFYTFLNQAVGTNSDLQIIITADNHDSAARLESPNPLLESSNIHIIDFVEKKGDGSIDYPKLIIPLKDLQGTAINQSNHRCILCNGEGHAEVDFIGPDGQAHTATRRIRWARNKVDGALKPNAIQLTHKLSGTVFPGKKKETADEIERLVDLNSEQFTRAVMLAHGDFTAFSKAAKDEKSALLEKLTGTRTYSKIFLQIFAH
ncbi:metallophosphoesterase family protein [Chitinophaga sancti]|uniref:Nuclease SbcCD subunit D n=1 Tax=Chitinophaga sancti TaxID=1004 RepID=A0A1K1LLS8_9BACT|nr:exonuclease subunit SbcD [Chitinophaga sancti]WQD65043.1 exonuclease subunit SbcD [Chitinophaga sancti]WQG89333.1 exonuclease subunit SbcD [Chitinophaga sancti]SFW11803.1 Exodeoxyribonuclease I subunit D [Chitinophaga sancti]